MLDKCRLLLLQWSQNGCDCCNYTLFQQSLCKLVYFRGAQYVAKEKNAFNTKNNYTWRNLCSFDDY